MTEQEVAEHSSTEEIERDIIRLEALKQRKKEIEEEIADIEAYLDKTLEKDHKFEDDDSVVIATVVRGYMDRFDEHLMSTRYVKIWDHVTKRRIDKALYLDAVRTGAITPALHKRFYLSVPKKSYVVVTRNKRRDTE